MPSLSVNQGNSARPVDSTVPRVGHVYLDVHHRLLHYLNVRAKQLHKEGVLSATQLGDADLLRPVARLLRRSQRCRIVARRHQRNIRRRWPVGC